MGRNTCTKTSVQGATSKRHKTPDIDHFRLHEQRTATGHAAIGSRFGTSDSMPKLAADTALVQACAREDQALSIDVVQRLLV